ncbi:MAG: FUSC family protein [Nakamurella sp.]
MTGRATAWLSRHDPELNSLHKAIKVAGAVTIGLAIGTLIGNPALSLFASFGGVALLLFADFPGSRSARLGAYLLLVPIGALLIVLGTLLATHAVLAVVGMAVVGFVVLFAGVLSAATAAASRAALLTYILPVTVPGPAAEILPRLAGWCIAAALAVPAAVFLWPPRDHDALRAKAAGACRAISEQLTAKVADAATTSTSPPTDYADRAAKAIAALRTQFRSSEFRPVGLTTGSRLLVQLVDRLEWLRSVVQRIPDGTSADWPAWNRDLVTACAGVLANAAQTMPVAGRDPSFATRQQLETSLHELEQYRRQAIESLELVSVGLTGSGSGSGAETGHGGGNAASASGPASGPASGLSPALLHELGYTTRLAGEAVANSAAADARPLLDRLLGRQHPGQAVRPLTAAQRLAAGAINRRSVWFQNSVRGALGLAFAVLLAEVTDVGHGFWVVLATMSVLRSSALNTGSNALRAIGGTFAGFLIGAALMFVVGTNPVALWVLLPFVVLVAAFVPAAISFAAGQAAFTVMVLVLFNIIDPVGWTVGLVRIEDILLGSLAGLVVGLLLWPRGAAAQIRNALAESYRIGGAALVAATRKTTSDPDPNIETMVVQALLSARAAAGRLDDAFRQYQSERGSKNIPISELTIGFNTASRMRLAAEAIATMTPSRLRAIDAGPQHPSARPLAPTSVTTAVRAACAELTDTSLATERWFDQTADVLDGKPTAAAAPCLPYAEDRVVTILRQDSAGLETREVVEWARTMWWAALYLDDVIRTQTRLATAVAAIMKSRPIDSPNQQ